MRAILVSGLGFGDCGKGSVTEYLCRKHGSKLVCRFNGGAQAAHHVVLADGRHHCFAQWGSGTFSGASTYLSKYMLVNPIFMLAEGEHLVSLGVTDAFNRMFIDQDALLTTPLHVSLNRLREVHRRVSSSLEHGTCGMGIGETVDWATRCPEWDIRMRDVKDLRKLAYKFVNIRNIFRREVQKLDCDWPKDAEVDIDILESTRTLDHFMHSVVDLLERGVTVMSPIRWGEIFHRDVTVIFEGAQGALLDEEWGFHPHTTWSDCTFGNALKILKQVGASKVTKVGVTRPYHTRHGEGPLPSYDPNLKSIGDHNTEGKWQGSFRVGYFDFMLARYAKFIVEDLDEIAVTHLDEVSGPQKVCIKHNFQGASIHQIRGMNHDLHRSFVDEYHEENSIQSVVSPVYTELKSVGRLLEGISRIFKAPITIRSYGPTAEDKRSS